MLEAILLPVAVLAAIGVLAGIMLALFSYFMKVPTDQKLEEVRAILSALEELDPRQREAVLLHYYQRRTVAEIAQAMDCSPSTAQRLLNRARGRLRQLLREE